MANEDDFDLVEDDDASALEERIRQGMDIDAPDDEGYTLLHVAASQQSVKCLGLLLQSGADHGKTAKYVGTPLHSAADSGSLESVKVYT